MILFWIIMAVGFALIVGGEINDYRRGKWSILNRPMRAIKSRRREEKAIALGEIEAVPEKFDPHYSRAIELEAGMKVETQCDNTECTICYWKAGHHIETEVCDWKYRAEVERMNKFIDSLPDGLSDELYDSMLEDYTEERDNKRKKDIEEKWVARKEPLQSRLLSEYSAKPKSKSQESIKPKFSQGGFPDVTVWLVDGIRFYTNASYQEYIHRRNSLNIKRTRIGLDEVYGTDVYSSGNARESFEITVDEQEASVKSFSDVSIDELLGVPVSNDMISMYKPTPRPDLPDPGMISRYWEVR